MRIWVFKELVSFIEALLPIFRCCNYAKKNEFCRKCWVLLRCYCPFSDVAIMPKKLSFVGNGEFYWGATIVIARGLLLSSSLGPRSFAFHKVIYSRLQPFTASPLEMTLWNPTVSIGSNATGRQYSQPPQLMKFSCLKIVRHSLELPKRSKIASKRPTKKTP